MADEINTTVTDEPIESVALTEIYIEYPNGKKVKARLTGVLWEGDAEEGDEE
jgi:hypothetical protein